MPSRSAIGWVNGILSCLVVLSVIAQVCAVGLEIRVAGQLRSRPLGNSVAFHRLLPARIALHTAALLWSLAAFLRLPLLWEVGWLPSISTKTQKALCQLHPVLAHGIGEPACLLVSLYAVRSVLLASSVTTAPAAPESPPDAKTDHKVLVVPQPRLANANCVILAQSIATCIPLLLVLGATVWSTAMPEHLRWDWGGLKDVWVETSRAKGGDDCQGLESECIYCMVPAAGVVLSAVFSVFYSLGVVRMWHRARSIVLNRVLEDRLWRLGVIAIGSSIFGTTLRTIALGVSVGGWAFWALTIADVLVALCASMILPAILAFCPALDILLALRSMSKASRSRAVSPSTSTRDLASSRHSQQQTAPLTLQDVPLHTIAVDALKADDHQGADHVL